MYSIMGKALKLPALSVFICTLSFIINLKRGKRNEALS